MTFSKPFGNVSMTSVKEMPRFLATAASSALVLGIPGRDEKPFHFYGTLFIMTPVFPKELNNLRTVKVFLYSLSREIQTAIIANTILSSSVINMFINVLSFFQRCLKN